MAATGDLPDEKKRGERIIRKFPKSDTFTPSGVPLSRAVIAVISPEELEAMRLIDSVNEDQESAASKMCVSRKTLGKDLARARKKIIDAIFSGSIIQIRGDNYRLIENEE